MKNFLFLISILFLWSCEKKPTEISNSEETDQSIAIKNALNVPVGKLGVYIYIDSIGIFQSEKALVDTHQTHKLNSELQSIYTNLKLDSIVKSNTIEFLTNHKKNFVILDQKKTSFDKRLINGKINTIDFSAFKPKEQVDDLLIIALQSGINYNQNEEIDGKTDIYLAVVDHKTHQLKYNEVISGSKYLNQKDFPNQTDYLKNLMLQSVETTIDLIQSTK